MRDEQVDGFTIYEFPDGRLQICKLADRADALPGEIVNFAIQVQNVGDAPVRRYRVDRQPDDSIGVRRWQPDLQRRRDLRELRQPGNRLRLQWRLTDKLRVGESVTIRFQCRVR